MGEHERVRRTRLAPAEVARRSGVPVSTLHFYEKQGLITAERTPGNQRRYDREVLRRIAFVQASSRVGIPLAEIRDALDHLPVDRAPTSTAASPSSRRCATSSRPASVAAACPCGRACSRTRPTGWVATAPGRADGPRPEPHLRMRGR